MPARGGNALHGQGLGAAGVLKMLGDSRNCLIFSFEFTETYRLAIYMRPTRNPLPCSARKRNSFVGAGFSFPKMADHGRVDLPKRNVSGWLNVRPCFTLDERRH
jgi:hypothetical protein